jgi:hypothetical protein
MHSSTLSDQPVSESSVRTTARLTTHDAIVFKRWDTFGDTDERSLPLIVTVAQRDQLDRTHGVQATAIASASQLATSASLGMRPAHTSFSLITSPGVASS